MRFAHFHLVRIAWLFLLGESGAAIAFSTLATNPIAYSGFKEKVPVRKWDEQIKCSVDPV